MSGRGTILWGVPHLSEIESICACLMTGMASHERAREGAMPPRGLLITKRASKHHLGISAESSPNLKNCEFIHFGFLFRGFVVKEYIHGS